ANSVAYLVVDAMDVQGVLMIDRCGEESTNFTVDSTWWRWAQSAQSGGAAQVSSTSGSAATFTFSGSTVRWIGQSGPDRAIANVSIDGTSYGAVDTYAPGYTNQAVLFSATGLSAGNHTITLTWSGKNAAANSVAYLVVDAMDVG